MEKQDHNGHDKHSGLHNNMLAFAAMHALWPLTLAAMLEIGIVTAYAGAVSHSHPEDAIGDRYTYTEYQELKQQDGEALAPVPALYGVGGAFAVAAAIDAAFVMGTLGRSPLSGLTWEQEASKRELKDQLKRKGLYRKGTVYDPRSNTFRPKPAEESLPHKAWRLWDMRRAFWDKAREQPEHQSMWTKQTPAWHGRGYGAGQFLTHKFNVFGHQLPDDTLGFIGIPRRMAKASRRFTL
jgi:hypothetical protein